MQGHWSIANYASNEAVGLGVATVAIVCSLLGILFCFTALILHSLTVHFSTAEVG